jgi:hypothetical protein
MTLHELAAELKKLTAAELKELESLGVKVLQPHTDVNNLPTPTCPQGYVFSNGHCVPDIG